jgi:tetratricopeptide (TPR) repeat protein
MGRRVFRIVTWVSVCVALVIATRSANCSIQYWTQSNDSQVQDLFLAMILDKDKDAIKVCREILSGDAPSEIHLAAEKCLIMSARRAFGYERAISEAESLRKSAQSSPTGSDTEVKMLGSILSNLRESWRVTGMKAGKQLETAGDTAYAAECVYGLAELMCYHRPYEVAIPALRKVIVKYPGSKQDFQSRIKVAGLLEAKGDIGNAKCVWLRGAAFAPDSEFAKRCVAELRRLYTADKTYSEGAKALLELAKSRPGTELAREVKPVMAELLRLSADYTSTVAVYWQVIQSDVDDKTESDSIIGMKDVLLKLKKPDDAIALLTEIVSKHPKAETRARAILTLNEIYRSQNNEKSEQESLVQLVSDFSDTKACSDAKKLIANTCEKCYKKADESRDTKAALPEYESLWIAYRLDCDQTRKLETCLRMASVLTDLGRYDEAQSDLRLILVDGSGASKSLRGRAKYQQAATYCRSGDMKSAKAIVSVLASDTEEPDDYLRQKAASLLKGIEMTETEQAK